MASTMGIWERIYGWCHNISQFKAMSERWQFREARMMLMMLK